MKSGLSEICIAAVLVALVGCSTETPSTPSVYSTSAQVGSEVDPAKVAETLKAARVVVKVQSCVSGAGEATFSANGKATGRVRGKFVASGAWSFYNGGGMTFWTFGETFKIKGRHPTTGTISGSGSDAIAKCKTFGPVSSGKDLTYHLGAKSGAASTKSIKNGAAFLEQLH